MAGKKEKLQKHELKPLKIGFGTVFTSTYYGESTQHVVVNVRSGKWFASAQIIENRGREALGIVGTGSRTDIREITGEWPLQRVLDAFANYFGGKASDELIKMITDSSHKKPRIIK